MNDLIVLYIWLALIFCACDILAFWIPNWIVLPGIVLTMFMTSNFLGPLVMAVIGVFVYKSMLIGEGDVKLLILLGAFLGINAVIPFTISMGLIYLFRKIKREKGVLPYAPFMFIAGLPFILIVTKGIAASK